MYTDEKDAEQLNSFLRGELAAVATYEQCIVKVTEPSIKAQLQSLQASHSRRAEALRARIINLGEQPADDAGVWGSVAQLLEGGAKMFGEKAAVSVLEEGEDHGLKDYQRDVERLSPLQRRFVESEVLPEQMRTHEILRGIESSL